MRGLKYLPLFAVLLTLFIEPSLASTPSRNISTSGTIIYPTTVVQRQMYENWRFPDELYATTTDLWIGHWDTVDRVPGIKALNSNFKAFLYVNIKEMFPTGTNNPPGSFDTFLNNGWLLQGANGTYCHRDGWGAYIVDIGNPEVQTWYANWIKSYLDTYDLDGVQLDNCVPVKGDFFWMVTPSPINPRTDQEWTNEDVRDAIIAIINQVKETITPKIVISNGINNGGHFYSFRQQYYIAMLLDSELDGVMSENWISSGTNPVLYSEDLWRKGVDMAVWLRDNFMPNGDKLFIPMCENAWSKEYAATETAFLPPGVNQDQYVTYAFASYLLAIGPYEGNIINLGYYMTKDYAQSLFNIDLGAPLSDYYIFEGTHVYARDFSNVKVLINPTANSYSVNLDENYVTFEGEAVTSPLTVEPYTGIILERT